MKEENSGEICALASLLCDRENQPHQFVGDPQTITMKICHMIEDALSPVFHELKASDDNGILEYLDLQEELLRLEKLLPSGNPLHQPEQGKGG